ncbi:hypothetical protein E3N88_25801 [Mikania micrantha]|uniref:Uncharacterized protein n=1 Tax=Mikania micrantha TaxID=192012 RepID=A0A5N6N6P7_9ASTR|nr:hypothetical protein E3N88_25801 [Mikania micrantha]
MPRLKKSVEDLLSKSDLGHEFSVEPVSLTIDPELKNINYSDNFELCAEKLSSSGQGKTNVSPSKENKVYSTITKETGSKLNPNYVPYIPNGSLKRFSSGSAPGSSDCDVRPFDLNEFHMKNQMVTPKAKPISKPRRIKKSSKPKVKKADVKQSRKAHNHHPARINKTKQNQNGAKQDEQQKKDDDEADKDKKDEDDQVDKKKDDKDDDGTNKGGAS